jgi:serine protease Do
MLLLAASCFAMLATAAPAAEPANPIVETIEQAQPKLVKIYGAGGPRGLEAYQSGFLISPNGHILTAFSTVLDTDQIDVTLADGRKFQAKMIGADPRLEVAVLKIEAADLPSFDLKKAIEAESGVRILALSNLFNVAIGNEQASVQRGTIAAKARLEARRGVFETPYDGPVYVLDVVTNNPGAAGGALVTRRGELLGMLGKELKNSLNDTWLNYAIPIGELRQSVEQIETGKFVVRRDEKAKKPAKGLTLALLGIVLVPDLWDRTPPYIDYVVPGSPAAKAGLRPDDIVYLVGERLTPSCKSLREELSYIDYEDKVKLTLLRSQDRGQEMVEVVVQPGGK